LQAKGHRVERDNASYGVYPTTAARVHALLLDQEQDRWTGGADPRGYGMALSA
jgi:gamma-glutamyltranspeptidase